MIISKMLKPFHFSEKNENIITAMVVILTTMMLLMFMYNAGLAVGEAYAHYVNAKV